MNKDYGIRGYIITAPEGKQWLLAGTLNGQAGYAISANSVVRSGQLTVLNAY